MTSAKSAFEPERLTRARQAVAASGLGAVFLTPGPDLRYVTGYDAIQLERLTCLVLPADGDPFLIVPRLELPAAQASEAGELGLEMVAWDETDDPFALVASRLPGDVTRVGVADRMWAVMALRFRAALPGAEQVPAGTVLRELRMRKSQAE
ncbi:aminopeptidase P family N-terminal domain-containing protein, partial [Actinoallomurus iriomotensis]|uniref:aminopeptidase P family N-terminal domain-containing protein n=1 Tax=Actinoallomurus iriomotensis TaxID=478107 RepID=UPI0025526B9C